MAKKQVACLPLSACVEQSTHAPCPRARRASPGALTAVAQRAPPLGARRATGIKPRATAGSPGTTPALANRRFALTHRARGPIARPPLQRDHSRPTGGLRQRAPPGGRRAAEGDPMTAATGHAAGRWLFGLLLLLAGAAAARAQP